VIYGNDPTPFSGLVVLHPSADSTPAPWGPPEGLGLKRFETAAGELKVHLVDYSRMELEDGVLDDIWLNDRTDLVPPTPGGES
jgi:hypothetical protein